MANALPRTSEAYARICYTKHQPVEAGRLDHWLDQLPYHKQIALGRKSRRREKTASLIGLQLLKLEMRRLGFSDFSLGDLELSPNGKPVGSNGANFSISHAGGLIACAVGVGVRVGLDLEPVPAHRSTLPLPRYMDAAELMAARRSSLEGLRIWTAKEAILKAAGGAGLPDLEAVTVRGNRGIFRGKTWYLEAPDLDDGYVARIATDQPGVPVGINRYDRLP